MPFRYDEHQEGGTPPWEPEGSHKSTVLQVIENFQELAWERIGRVVTSTVKHLLEAPFRGRADEPGRSEAL